MIKLLSVLFFSFFSFGLFAQKCATISFSEHLHSHVYRGNDFEEQLERHLQKAAKTTLNEEVYVIPVVVHVIHNDNSGEIGTPYSSNISLAQIESQIEVLNEDFRRRNADTSDTPDYFKPVATDTKIEFCLASTDPNGNATDGVVRVYSNQLPYNVNSSSDQYSLKGESYWPNDQYLNIWVTELMNSVLGQAQFPSGTNYDGLNQSMNDAETDGVIMDHRYFGNEIGTVATNSYPAYRNGRTLTHEVGHWLGLLHIWGDFNSCNATDYCDDTPSQKSDNGLLSQSQCGNAIFECGSEVMYQNYMDYTRDKCMNIFTQDQKNRMRGAIEIDPRRQGLLSSTGCCGSEKRFVVPFVEYFDEHFESNYWNVSVSDSNKVFYSNDELSSALEVSFDSIGYVELESQIIDVQNTSQLYFLLDIEQGIDSVELYYDKGCSGVWTWFTTLHSEDFEFIDQFDVLRSTFYENDLAGTGYLSFRIKIHGHADFSIQRFEVRGEQTPQVKLLPNPSNGEFILATSYLETQDIHVRIYDLTGRLIQDYSADSVYEEDLLLRFYPQSAGVYLVWIELGEQLFKYKVMVE